MNTKKMLLILVAVLAVAGYVLLQTDAAEINPGLNTQYSTFSSSELGIEFSYRSGPQGYVLEESAPADAQAGLVKVLTLIRAEDASREMPVGGEGPAIMAVHIFENPQKQWPQMWADTHIPYSNINLKTGDVSETTVGGANAIRYIADGLYASENAVVAHGDSIYVITGQFLDKDSDIRRDFQPLLESIRFISKPGQE
ncbi:MAG: hypothetical protein WC790_01865 [Candidatus Paceibacterota bacterium]|jgi:hypothetical protein